MAETRAVASVPRNEFKVQGSKFKVSLGINIEP